MGKALREVKQSAYAGDAAYEKVKPVLFNGAEVSAEQIAAALTVQGLYRRRSSGVKGGAGGKPANGKGARKPGSAAGAALAFGGPSTKGRKGNVAPRVKPLSTQQATGAAAGGRPSVPLGGVGVAQSARPAASSCRGGKPGVRRAPASQRDMSAGAAGKEVRL